MKDIPKKIMGTCWCGGNLVKEGRYSTRCLKCDRIKYIKKRSIFEGIKRWRWIGFFRYFLL